MGVTGLIHMQMAAAMAVGLALGLVLLAARPRERASVRNALVLLGLCALVHVAQALWGWSGMAAAIAVDSASVVAGVVLIRLAVIFVFSVALPALGANPPRIAEELSAAALFVAWGLLWLRIEGVDLAGLVATSAVITAVLAFSMQDTLGNVLGGVVLQLDHSIRVGDWVRVDDVSGRVAKITWRHTAIATRNGESVVIPNGWLMKNRFTVVGTRAQGQPWRRWVRLNVESSAPPSRVCAVMEAAVRDARIEHVAADPAPSAVLMEIGPRYGGYALRYWLDNPEPDDATDSAVRIHLLAALARNAMKVGAPYREQLEIKDNEAHREAARAAERERRAAALSGVDLFAPLSEAEREALADHLAYAPFIAGDIITRQGATAHWLYLVISGDADVWIDTPQGTKAIATLGPGQVFGEMGMMTGAPRSATVGARTDVVCYRLDKAGFQNIIDARPDVASTMSVVLANRQTDLRGKGAVAEGPMPTHHADILARIRDFFGLRRS